MDHLEQEAKDEARAAARLRTEVASLHDELFAARRRAEQAGAAQKRAEQSLAQTHVQLEESLQVQHEALEKKVAALTEAHRAVVAKMQAQLEGERVEAPRFAREQLEAMVKMELARASLGQAGSSVVAPLQVILEVISNDRSKAKDAVQPALPNS